MTSMSGALSPPAMDFPIEKRVKAWSRFLSEERQLLTTFPLCANLSLIAISCLDFGTSTEFCVQVPGDAR